MPFGLLLRGLRWPQVRHGLVNDDKIERVAHAIGPARRTAPTIASTLANDGLFPVLAQGR